MRLQGQTGRDRNLAAGVKSNNHHTVVYLRKAVTSKPKKIEIRRCSYFVAPEKLFPMVIWLLILKFFLSKLLPTKVKRSDCLKSNNHHTVMYLWKAATSKPKKIENCGCIYFVAPKKFFPTVIWFLILKFFLTKLQPTKVKRSECPKSNQHHTVVYLGKAVTSKPKKIENRGCSYYVALDKFFPTVIWFLILKFFLTKLLPTKVKRSECPKSNNHLTVVYLGKAVTFWPKKIENRGCF